MSFMNDPICPCFYLRNDYAESCYCGNWKVTRIRVRFFTNFLLLVRIRVWKKSIESCRSRLRHSGPWPLLTYTSWVHWSIMYFCPQTRSPWYNDTFCTKQVDKNVQNRTLLQRLRRLNHRVTHSYLTGRFVTALEAEPQA